MERCDLEVMVGLEWEGLVLRGHASHFLEVQGRNE